MTNRLLSIREAASLLGIKEKTLYQWKWRRRNLKFIKLGRALKVSKKDLEEFIKERTIYPIEGP